MGMGKTLQAISLVLTNLPGPDVKNRTTLVVCPVVALVQWHTEILRYTKENQLKILIYLPSTNEQEVSFICTTYHGTDRLVDVSDDSFAAIAKYDIVLTTYSIVVCRKLWFTLKD